MLVRKTVLVRKMVLNRKNWKKVGGLFFPQSMPLAEFRQKEAVSDTMRVEVVYFLYDFYDRWGLANYESFWKHSMLLVEMTVTVKTFHIVEKIQYIRNRWNFVIEKTNRRLRNWFCAMLVKYSRVDLYLVGELTFWKVVFVFRKPRSWFCVVSYRWYIRHWLVACQFWHLRSDISILVWNQNRLC